MFDMPDVIAMRNAKAACNSKIIAATVYQNATEYLPNLFVKFNNLNNVLNGAHSGLTESAQKISHTLEISIRSIVRYKNDLAEVDDDDEREYILKRISEVMSRATTTTGEETKKLADRLKSLSETFNRESTLSSLGGLNIQAEKLPEDLTELEQRKSTQQGELLTLNSAIQALEGKGFAAIGEEAILNAESLAALQLGGPAAVAVKAALDLLQKSLADLDAALNYFGLLSLRNNLHMRIEAETQKINHKKAETRTVDQRIKFIETIHGFDDERVIYLQEYAKIITSFRSFLNKYMLKSQNSEASVDEWIPDAKAFLGYLPPIR